MEVSRIDSAVPPVITRVQPYVSVVVRIALAVLASLSALYLLARLVRYCLSSGRVSRRAPPPSSHRPPQIDHVDERPRIAPSEAWPKPVIDMIGRERFDELPTLKVNGSKLVTLVEGLNPYIVLEPGDVPQDLMKVEDPFQRKGLCWVYTEKASGKSHVDIIFLRDVAEGRWYYNNERSAMNQDVEGLISFPQDGGGSLSFLKKLLEGTHKHYKLRNAAD